MTLLSSCQRAEEAQEGDSAAGRQAHRGYWRWTVWFLLPVGAGERLTVRKSLAQRLETWLLSQLYCPWMASSWASLLILCLSVPFSERKDAPENGYVRIPENKKRCGEHWVRRVHRAPA